MAIEPIIRYTGERPRYFDRQVLRAEDLGLEQAEIDRRRRQLSRFLHGWGVVAGFALDAAAMSSDPERPPDESLSGTELRVRAGFAVTPLGTEIFLPEDVVLDEFLCRIPAACRPPGTDCGDIDPLPEDPDAPAPPIQVHVIAEPASRGTRPLPARPEGCGHPGNALSDSRTCDGIALRVICGPLTPPHDRDRRSCEDAEDWVCGGTQMLQREVAMPPTWGREQDFVVLGSVLVERTEGSRERRITEVSVEARRRLLPVDILQRRLECLCTAPPPSPFPTRTSTPTSTATFTPTFTRTINPTFTATAFPTLTATATFTRTAFPTFTATVEPTLVATIRPTVNPTLGATLVNPGATVPGPGLPDGPVIFSDLDPARFDVDRGAETRLDSLGFLTETEREGLRASGIESALDLHTADADAVRDMLGTSDVRSAEIRTEALNAFLRTDVRSEDPAHQPVSGLAGIGPRRTERLEGAGITTIGAFAATPVDRVSDVLGVRESVASDMVAEARLHTGRG